MYRSIFFNLWVALIAFAAYFLYVIYKTNGFANPISTIISSFVAAVIGFVVAYALRYLVDFVLYTPEDISFSNEDLAQQQANHTEDRLAKQLQQNSTVEFADESSEDIAQVVRTMLNHEDPVITK